MGLLSNNRESHVKTLLREFIITSVIFSSRNALVLNCQSGNTFGVCQRRESHANVLKLVHHGGFVELHTKPFMASEVMKKNPRHCVTRPDIFHFPWIVVNPEAILRPGKVFFIVPCHTIRHLLKKSTSTVTNHSLRHLHQFDHYESSFVDQDRQRKHNENSKGQNGAIKLPLYAESVSGEAGRERHVYHSRECYYYVSHDAGRESHSEQMPNLKSCQKKDNIKSHNARTRNLKVRFECNEEQVIKSL